MIRCLLIKNTAKPYVALQYLTWLRDFCPLLRGKYTQSMRGLPSPAEEGAFLLDFCKAINGTLQLVLCKKPSVTAKNMRSNAYFFNATSNPTPQSRQ